MSRMGTNGKVVQPSPERLSVQLNYMERRYEEALTKVLEQNREILTSVASIKTELRTLRDKVESLEVASATQEEPGQTRANGLDARSTPGGSSSPAVGQFPSPGQFPEGPAPFPGHHGYFNPYAAAAAYNPYNMIALNQMFAGMLGSMNQAGMSPLGMGQGGASGGDARNPCGGTPLAGNSFTGNPLGMNQNQSYRNVQNAGFMPTPEATASAAPAKTDTPSNLSNLKSNAGVTPTQSIFGAGVTSGTPTQSIFGAGVTSGTPTQSIFGQVAKTAAAPSVSTVKPAPSVSFTFQTASVKTPPKEKDIVDGGIVPKTSTSVPVGTSAPAKATPTVVQDKPFQFGVSSTSSQPATATSSVSALTFSYGSTPTPAVTTPTSVPKANVVPSVVKTASGETMTAVKQPGVKSNLFGSEAKTDTSSTTPFGSAVTDQKKTPFGFGASASGSTFSSLASSQSNSIGNGGIFGGFTFASPKPMFGDSSSSATALATKSSESPSRAGNPEEGEDEFVPTAVFEPVIPLPPLVEVKRGDENENILFAHRAKLLRYTKNDAGSAEWKERGLGDIKILQDKENPKKIRVVMWREKVHKIACNHWVTKDIKVTNYQGSPKNLMWTAYDFADAEEGPKSEIFVCRFREEEKAQEFKAEFEKAIALVDALPTTPQSNTKKPETVSSHEHATTAVPLSQLFKKPEGNWNCESCYTENKKDSLLCAACQAPNPKAACSPNTQVSSTSTTVTATPQFTFGHWKSNAGVTPTQSIFGQVAKTEPAKDSTPSFDFGKKSEAMPSFATLASRGSTPVAKPFSGSFTFGSGPVAPIFGSASTPASTKQTTEEGRDDEHGDDEFVPTAEFAPVVPLPPLVDVKRGDEDENKLFSHRAKLLRFTKNESGASEWKERGVGDIKLLQAKDNEGKIRVVMWREKVHKIACNHWVTKDMKVTNYQGNPKNLMWTAFDFADVEEGPKSEIFVCRFGNEEKAQEFKKEFEKAIELVGKHGGVTSSDGDPKPQGSTGSAPVKSLAEFCKKAEGDWSCSTCYCTNSKDKTSCVSCATPKPGSIGDATLAGLSNNLNNVNLASTAASKHENPHPLDGPNCRGCDPEKFDFQKLDGRQVPAFEDIPKPTKNDSSELKGLLSKPAGTASPFTFTPNFGSFNPTGSTSIFGTPLSIPKDDATVPKTVNGNDEDDDEDGGEEEDEDDPMFSGEGHGYFRKQGQTNFEDYGEGEVKIVYDGDRFCARFFFMAHESEDYIDHHVSTETSVESSGTNTYEWNCVHYDEEGMPVRGRVKIAFPDQQSFDQFSSSMYDAVELAQQTNITEEDLEAYPDDGAD